MSGGLRRTVRVEKDLIHFHRMVTGLLRITVLLHLLPLSENFEKIIVDVEAAPVLELELPEDWLWNQR